MENTRDGMIAALRDASHPLSVASQIADVWIRAIRSSSDVEVKATREVLRTVVLQLDALINTSADSISFDSGLGAMELRTRLESIRRTLKSFLEESVHA